MEIAYLAPDSFDWLTWSAGRIQDLGVECCRTQAIIRNKEVIRKYAIGYCPSQRLRCRPKKEGYAIMFLKDDIFFWTHLTDKEFIEVFQKRGDDET